MRRATGGTLLLVVGLTVGLVSMDGVDAAFATGAPAASAPQARTPIPDGPEGCVKSHSVFKAARKGFTPNQVHRLWGTRGWLHSQTFTGEGDRLLIRAYKICESYVSIRVGYVNGDLDWKSWIGWVESQPAQRFVKAPESVAREMVAAEQGLPLSLKCIIPVVTKSDRRFATYLMRGGRALSDPDCAWNESVNYVYRVDGATLRKVGLWVGGREAEAYCSGLDDLPRGVQIDLGCFFPPQREGW